MQYLEHTDTKNNLLFIWNSNLTGCPVFFYLFNLATLPEKWVQHSWLLLLGGICQSESLERLSYAFESFLGLGVQNWSSGPTKVRDSDKPPLW